MSIINTLFVILVLFPFITYNPAGFQKSIEHHLHSESRINSSKEKKLRSDIVKTAVKCKGSNYSYGGNGPKAFDCSGFTNYVYKQYDIPLARSSRDQAKQGKKKSIKNVESGDLLFFGYNGKINHVGIFLDRKGDQFRMIHASTSKGVIIEDISQSDYWKKRLFFAKEMIKN